MIRKVDFLVVLAQSGDAVIEPHAGVSIAQFAHSLAVAYIGMGNNGPGFGLAGKSLQRTFR
jgi:hypothetical protein